MSQIAPFHNEAIQGPRANIRAAMRNPSKFAWRGLQLSALTFLLWWQFKDEDWWIDMDLREKFLHWHIPFTNPFSGEEELLRIPRAFEVGTVFSALPEALLDGSYHQDPEGVEE